MLDNILKKLGIYDLIGVLFTGIIIATICLAIISFFSTVDLQFNKIIENNLLQFFVISYFLGLVFQEIGSFIYKILFKNNILLSALKGKNDDSLSMSMYEISELKEKIINECHIDKSKEIDPIFLYNYCKYYCKENCNTNRSDRDQSIAAMGRSLSLFFLILSFSIIVISIMIIFFGNCIIIKNTKYLLPVFALTSFLSILMFRRFKRFTKIRYIDILRTYLYHD